MVKALAVHLIYSFLGFTMHSARRATNDVSLATHSFVPSKSLLSLHFLLELQIIIQIILHFELFTQNFKIFN